MFLLHLFHVNNSDLLFTFTNAAADQAMTSRDNFSRALTAIQTANAATAAAANVPQVKLEPGLPPLSAAGPDSDRKRPMVGGSGAPRILPSAGPRPPQKVLEVRAKLLARDKELKLLHTSLVEGGVVSEEEFWEARKVSNCTSPCNACHIRVIAMTSTNQSNEYV
jgi:hypothetical protein